MEWIQQLLGVAFVLGLLGASLFWLRRRGLVRPSGASSRRRPGQPLELLDRVALTPQHSVHLVRMGDRMILVGRAPTGLTRLASAAWKEPEGAE